MRTWAKRPPLPQSPVSNPPGKRLAVRVQIHDKFPCVFESSVREVAFKNFAKVCKFQRRLSVLRAVTATCIVAIVPFCNEILGKLPQSSSAHVGSDGTAVNETRIPTGARMGDHIRRISPVPLEDAEAKMLHARPIVVFSALPKETEWQPPGHHREKSRLDITEGIAKRL